MKEHFDVQFPSLLREYADPDFNGFYPDSLMEHCLDKQKVKEAIDKLERIRFEIPNEKLYFSCIKPRIELLKKELGI